MATYLASAHSGESSPVSSYDLPEISPSGDKVQLIGFVQNRPDHSVTPPSGWDKRLDVLGGADARYIMIDRYYATGSPPYTGTVEDAVSTCYWGGANFAFRATGGPIVNYGSESVIWGTGSQPDKIITATMGATPTAGNFLVAYTSRNTDQPGTDYGFVWPFGWTVAEHLPSLPEGVSAFIGDAEVAYKLSDGTEDEVSVQALHPSVYSQVLLIGEYPLQVPDLPPAEVIPLYPVIKGSGRVLGSVPYGGSGTPSTGQEIVEEPTPPANGSITTFYTSRPFAEGSLVVLAAGLDQTGAVVSSIGSSGSFTLGFAPSAGSPLLVSYLVP